MVGAKGLILFFKDEVSYILPKLQSKMNLWQLFFTVTRLLAVAEKKKKVPVPRDFFFFFWDKGWENVEQVSYFR